MQVKLEGFAPIAAVNAEILILGSMPGAKSIADSEYYAHPYNAFWFIITKLFNLNSSLSYQQKIKLLIENKIALWDVLQSCQRKGSLDSNIRAAEVNDFVSFFETHKAVRKVCFNGQKAAQLFQQYVQKPLNSLLPRLEYHVLPSTSPAMAKLSREDKFAVWQKVLN